MHRQAPEAPDFGILKQLQPRRNPRERQLPALFTQPGPEAVIEHGAEECSGRWDCRRYFVQESGSGAPAKRKARCAATAGRVFGGSSRYFDVPGGLDPLPPSIPSGARVTPGLDRGDGVVI